MNILLFGKNGQIGWEINQLLPGLGKVSAPERLDADFARPESLRQVIRKEQPDIIVNAAAYTAVDKAEEEKDLAMKINAEAPGVVAQEAEKLGAVMVHYSTDYVFDGTSTRPYVEIDEPLPVNTYGVSKLAGERAVRSSGCRHLIFRTSWVYSSRRSNFYLTVRRLVDDGKALNIVSDQTGAPTWAGMIAGATVEVLSQSIREIASGAFTSDVYHLASRGRTSWYGFARQIIDNICAIAGTKPDRLPAVNPIASADYPTAARRPGNSCLDVGKIERRYKLKLPEWDESLYSFMQSQSWSGR